MKQFIEKYSDFLSEEMLESAVKECNSATLKATIGLNSINENVRKTLVSIMDSDNTLSNYILNKLSLKTQNYFEDKKDYFTQDLKSSLNSYIFQPLNFLKYKSGGFYITHSDDNFRPQYSDSFVRRLSYVVFLNENFSGGSLEFPYLDFCVRPERNCLLIFPSNWCFSHTVNPVYNGTRYSLVTWGGFYL